VSINFYIFAQLNLSKKTMASILNEYISKRWGVLELKAELKNLIGRYNTLTNHNLFVYAADFNKGRQGIDVSLMQDDFYTIQDILRESDKKQIDVYLETPGGSGEAAEEIAKFLRKKFDEVNYVIAGEAKSAGTILALSGDNIYMCETGSLGPIDAQIKIGRSVVSAHDYKAWVDEKRKEATNSGRLNPFDAIMVAQISPGEIYGVVNSLEFAKDLVKGWLEKYKFKNWTETQTTHKSVTPEMRKKRAEEVADKLSDHMS
jgi:ClpP class serine protease